MNLRKFSLRALLTAAVLTLAVFLAPSAHADDVTLTMSPASLTITEGNSITLTFTVTNVSSDTVHTKGFGGFSGFFTGPDLSDIPVIKTLFPGTCSFSLVGTILVPGGSCTFGETFATDNPSGETDVDFGMASNASVDVAYCIFSPTGACTGINGGATLFDTNDVFNVIVKDPAPTPEPSSAHLVFAGLAALLGLGWLCSRN